MGYLVALIIGLFCGALAVWLLIMGFFERARQSEESARKTLEKVKAESLAVVEKEQGLKSAQERFEKEFADFQARVVSYKEIQQENTLLKRDLQNMDVTTNKLEMDGEVQKRRTDEIDERSRKLASRYLAETVKTVVASVGPNNFSACKQRLLDVIGRCREIGFAVSAEEESNLLANLKSEFEKEVRAAFEREEQARIKAQIREEEKIKRDAERERQLAEREAQAIQAALDQALAAANGAHSLEVDRLQMRLAEAEERAKRAIANAQVTKSGHVYIISNIGSLGAGIFKIGMSRRDNPLERVFELGSASVPFPFDVHMMIHTSDAPKLENTLHRVLHKRRVNRANPKKEFFRATIEEIYTVVTAHHGEVQYVADPEALEYNQSQSMSDEDAAFIEDVFSKAEQQTAGQDAED